MLSACRPSWCTASCRCRYVDCSRARSVAYSASCWGAKTAELRSRNSAISRAAATKPRAAARARCRASISSAMSTSLPRSAGSERRPPFAGGQPEPRAQPDTSAAGAASGSRRWANAGHLGGLGVLSGLGVGLGQVDGARDVVGRSVERVEPGRAGTHVGEVVPGAGRYDHDVAGTHLAGDTADLSPYLTLHERQQLVVVLVYLGADVLAGLQGHHHELEVLGRVEDAPEGVVGPGGFGDVDLVHVHSLDALLTAPILTSGARYGAPGPALSATQFQDRGGWSGARDGRGHRRALPGGGTLDGCPSSPTTTCADPASRTSTSARPASTTST